MLFIFHVLYFSISVTCTLQIGHKWSQVVAIGHKNISGTVGVFNYKGRVKLRWSYQSKRYSLNLSIYPVSVVYF